MGNKKDVLPIVVASAVALVITGIVRFFLPTGVVVKQQPLKKELSLQNIPLMIKSEQGKAKEVQVLVTNVEIKKDEKIVQDKLIWRTWPGNVVQPNFIAQDNKGAPLNNRTDHSNALKMWAKNDIPVGIPLTIGMLTNVDPVETERKAREAEEAEAEKKKEEEEKKEQEETLVRVGYRAVPFQINSRTPISTNIISPGDYVDVFINATENNKRKTHVYKGMRIIAIDGVTKKRKEEKKSSEGGFFGGGSINLGGLMSPKNVTLEVKESLVNTMLKQAENNGITIALRSHEEEEADGAENTENSEASTDTNIIKDIWEMTRSSSSDVLRETAKKLQSKEKDISALLHDMNNLSIQSARNNAASKDHDQSAAKKVEEKPIKPAEKPVKIYRSQSNPEEVQFDGDGKEIKGGSGSFGGGLEGNAARNY